MNSRRDPTANQALGAVSREWDRMVRLAIQIRRNPNTEWAEQQRRRFTGIYKRLLTDPLDEGKKHDS